MTNFLTGPSNEKICKSHLEIGYFNTRSIKKPLISKYIYRNSI